MKSQKLFFILTIFFFSVIAISSNAQQPEPVCSFVKQYQTNEWYIQQANLWKNSLDKNKGNAIGWYYYFTANRMIQVTELNKDQAKKDMTESLDDIAKHMSKYVPNSYEYNLVMSELYSKENKDGKPFLMKAYQLDPNRPQTYDDLVTDYEFSRDQVNKEAICKKWFNSNDYSAGILCWDYNMIIGLDSNAIIFTGGDNDTYPAWILQGAQGVRPDVMVINLSMLMRDDYLKKICNELGIPPFAFKKYDDEEASAFGKYLAEHITHRPVYFAGSVDPTYYKKFQDSMYLEGLALKYSAQRYDNVAVIQRNVEQNFLLDYITHPLQHDISESVVKQMNSSYLSPFFSLYEHYGLSGETGKQEKLKMLMLQLAQGQSYEADVKNYLAGK